MSNPNSRPSVNPARSNHVDAPYPPRAAPLLPSRLIVILTVLLLVVAAEAHVVQQLFAEVKRGGADWEVEVLFDAGYAKPEWREDPESPQPTRQWLVDLSRDEQLALCEEASAYLDECLSFSSPEGPIELKTRFIDFAKSPPEFPSLLNDGAYLRIRLVPENPGIRAQIECKLAEGKRPDFVFKTTSPEEPEPKYLTLRPGESFVLHQGEGSPSATTITHSVREESVYLHSLKQGFLHVLPGGLDHILFILALFFLQRKWKPLLWQSLAFTAAHTLTLGLTAVGILAPKSGGVEALIALSIAVIALENLFKKECTPWRIIMVFSFGLIHGMGFAIALSSQLTPGESFLGRLVTTNIGVEIAQLAILGSAWVLTAKCRDGPHYETARKAINIVIAIIASLWLIQRFASV